MGQRLDSSHDDEAIIAMGLSGESARDPQLTSVSWRTGSERFLYPELDCCCSSLNCTMSDKSCARLLAIEIGGLDREAREERRGS